MQTIRIINRWGWNGKVPGTICKTGDIEAFNLVNSGIAEIVQEVKIIEPKKEVEKKLPTKKVEVKEIKEVKDKMVKKAKTKKNRS